MRPFNGGLRLVNFGESPFVLRRVQTSLSRSSNLVLVYARSLEETHDWREIADALIERGWPTSFAPTVPVGSPPTPSYPKTGVMSGSATTHPEWCGTSPSCSLSGEQANDRGNMTALHAIRNHPRALAASSGASLTAGSFFGLMYCTRTCSIVPLNLNGTLSK